MHLVLQKEKAKLKYSVAKSLLILIHVMKSFEKCLPVQYKVNAKLCSDFLMFLLCAQATLWWAQATLGWLNVVCWCGTC